MPVVVVVVAGAATNLRRRFIDQRDDRRRLSDLFGALPATRPFPGGKEVRESVGQELARRDHRSEGLPDEDGRS